MRLAFDIETNGLLDQLDTVHCIVAKDLDTGEFHSFDPTRIPHALELLSRAEELVGHNIMGFDLPALQIVYPDWVYTGRVTDTLVLSRLIHNDLLAEDFAKNYTDDQLPKRLHGSHSLKAWGLRLLNFKDDYDGGWSDWSEEMQSYCQQDVEVTASLYAHLKVDEYSSTAIDLEHDLAAICEEIGDNGWTFDEKKAGILYGDLCQQRGALQEELQELFEPWEVHETIVPKVNNSKLGYVKGEPFTKTKVVQFNPNSRRHIQRCLVAKYKWKPKEWTSAGTAKIDETVLASLAYPEAKKLARMFLLQKRIGQLAEGRTAWLRAYTPDDKKIRHKILSNGAVTGRATHRSPNLAQVPKVSVPFGRECRELFTVPRGYKLVGADLSGLELRCLAHYMQDTEYTKQILEGDIHTYNQKAAGLPDRNSAKTYIYAALYGAGSKRLGEIIGGGAKEGTELKKRFEAAVPSYRTLQSKVIAACERGYLIGLDGRRLPIRSQHAALNMLLQAAGAIICKKWVSLIYHQLKQDYADTAYIMAWVHDEVQIAVRKGQEDDVGNITRRMAQEAGRAFKITLPIEAEHSVGQTWADTH